MILGIAGLLAFIVGSCADVPTGQLVTTTFEPGSSTITISPVTTSPPGIPEAGDPGELANDPDFGPLVVACHDGDFNACDILFSESPGGSAFEQYGATCGIRNESSGSCLDIYSPVFSDDVSPRLADPESDQVNVIVAERMAAQAAFDRFVLEFSGTGQPGFSIRYVDDVESLLPDDRPMDGKAFLVIELSPATTVTNENLSRVGLRLTSDTRNVKELVLVEDSDGVIVWVASLEELTGFEVFRIDDPARLVIDISHG